MFTLFHKAFCLFRKIDNSVYCTCSYISASTVGLKRTLRNMTKQIFEYQNLVARELPEWHRSIYLNRRFDRTWDVEISEKVSLLVIDMHFEWNVYLFWTLSRNDSLQNLFEKCHWTSFLCAFIFFKHFFIFVLLEARKQTF